jgi:hypothetical protein
VVFNPNQIKSATGNTGAFSRDNNDIRYSIADPLTEAKRKAGFGKKKSLSETIQGILNQGVSVNVQAFKDYLPEIKPVLEQGYMTDLAQLSDTRIRKTSAE